MRRFQLLDGIEEMLSFVFNKMTGLFVTFFNSALAFTTQSNCWASASLDRLPRSGRDRQRNPSRVGAWQGLSFRRARSADFPGTQKACYLLSQSLSAKFYYLAYYFIDSYRHSQFVRN